MMTTEHDNMTSGGFKKFLFETEFGLEKDILAPVEDVAPQDSEDEQVHQEHVEPEFIEEIVPTFSEEELNQARAEGMQAGRDEATRDLTQSLEQHIATTLVAINDHVATLFDAYAVDKEEHSRDAVTIATVIVRKLFPTINMEHALTEVEQVIIDAMRRTSASPSIIIKVPPDIHARIEEKVKEMAALQGRKGIINVIADQDMEMGDLKIEWDGGGILRNTEFLWQEIDTIIEKNLGSRPSALKNDTPISDTETQNKRSETVNTESNDVNEENVAESEQNDDRTSKDATTETDEPQQPNEQPNDLTPD